MSELSDNFRARVLEILELVADAEAQRQYQASVPYVDVPAELFNQWEESFFPASDQFRAAFNDVELGALRRFDLVVNDVSTQTPKQLPALDAFVRTAAWQRLSDAARATLRDLKR
jgi:hypothetical protein